MNTKIAKSENFTAIHFYGDQFSNECYIIACNDLSKIKASYNTNINGLISEGIENVSKPVNKSISQKWLNGEKCEVFNKNYISAKIALETELNFKFNGGISDIATIYY